MGVWFLSFRAKRVRVLDFEGSGSGPDRAEGAIGALIITYTIAGGSLL